MINVLENPGVPYHFREVSLPSSVYECVSAFYGGSRYKVHRGSVFARQINSSNFDTVTVCQ